MKSNSQPLTLSLCWCAYCLLNISYIKRFIRKSIIQLARAIRHLARTYKNDSLLLAKPYTLEGFSSAKAPAALSHVRQIFQLPPHRTPKLKRSRFKKSRECGVASEKGFINKFKAPQVRGAWLESWKQERENAHGAVLRLPFSRRCWWWCWRWVINSPTW